MSRRRAGRWQVWAALLSLCGPQGHAQTADSGFQLPSGRLHCSYDPGDAQQPASLRCDVLEPSFRRPPSEPCPLDFGDSLALTTRGRPQWVCHGDTVLDPQHPVLAYGQTWSWGGFRCTSATTGVRCVNIAGHGFELARRAYRLF